MHVAGYHRADSGASKDHGHNHDHVHEERSVVEQRAVDEENHINAAFCKFHVSIYTFYTDHADLLVLVGFNRYCH